MKIKGLCIFAGICLISGLLLAAQSQAAIISDFIIDDFNTTNTYSVSDNTPGGAGEFLTTPIDSNNTVWNSLGGGTGIERRISSRLVTGDASVSTDICAFCQTAHVVTDASPIDNYGDFGFYWWGPSVDLTGYSTLEFDWGADLGGAQWAATIFDADGNWADSLGGALPATPGPGSLTHTAILDLPPFGVGDTGYADIRSIQLFIYGVNALDGNIDNVRLVAVPEPSTLLLLGTGLLGLAGISRRRKA